MEKKCFTCKHKSAKSSGWLPPCDECWRSTNHPGWEIGIEFEEEYLIDKGW